MRLYSICLYLTDFTNYNTVEVHSFCLKWQSFLVLLWLNNITLHIYVCVCLCIYISHNFFICSVSEHVDYFHVFAIVNNALVNMGVQVAFQISIFVSFGLIPRSGTAGSYGSSIFSF